jgi:hypothetical protein
MFASGTGAPVAASDTDVMRASANVPVGASGPLGVAFTGGRGALGGAD